MKKKMRVICIFLALGIMLSSCSAIKEVKGEDDNRDPIKKERRVVKEAELNIPLTRIASLDPLKNRDYTYYNFSKLVYQSLFEFDKDLKAIPLLVDNYKIVDQGRTLELELKKDIYWHNGDRLTTKDVEFTLNRLKDLKEASIYGNMLASALDNFKVFNLKSSINTRIVNESMMEIHFNKAYGNILEALTFPIVNQESYLEDDQYKPIGTGPFVYLDYNSSQGISLIRNSSYWDGEVSISKVNGKIFENEESILLAFEDGRVDFAYSMGVDLNEYENNPNINVLEYISPEYEFLAYNFANELLSGENGKDIRKAIYYGINRQEIIEEVYLGHATQVDTPIFPESYLTQSVTNTYGYNASKAREILKSIGFEDRGHDGILKDYLGRRLSFEIVTNYSNSSRRGTAEIIKKNLEEIGVEIIFKYPYSDMDSLDKKSMDLEWKELNKLIKTGAYDLSILGWETSELNDISFMFHSSFIKSGSNLIRYKDKDMDTLLKDLYFISEEEKIDKYEELQEKIMEDLPYASLFFKSKALLLRENIKGDFKPTFFNLYSGLEKYKLLEDIE